MNSRLLLDSHVLLWLLKEPGRVGRKARSLITQAQAVYVSAASVWELEVKHSRGKLPGLPASLGEAVEQSGFLPLAVTFAHGEAIASIKLAHKDPFDQLLVAQAQVERLTLVTADEQLLLQPGTVDARR